MFGAIGKAIGSVASAVGNFASSALGSLTGGDLLSAGASLFGAMQGHNAASANVDAQREANLMNIQLAKDQMAFQERMRETQYQTAVKDIQAAGLNPMLAYQQGGAGVPAGATAVVQPTHTAQSFSSALGAIDTVIRGLQARAAIENINADSLVKAASVNLLNEQAKNVAADTTTKSYQPAKVAAEARKTELEGDYLQKAMYLMIDKLSSEVNVNQQSARQLQSQNMLNKAAMENPALAPVAPLLQLIFGK